VDFKLANSYAEQIVQSGDDHELFKKLTLMSISYMMYIRVKFAFHKIPTRHIKDHLASEAVGIAIMAMARRNLPFTICIRNAFRDLCRQRLRIIRERRVGNIMEKCNIGDLPKVVGVGPRRPAHDVKVEDDEIIKLSHDLLNNHDPFSKKVVLQKTRGSTYPEMAEIFSTKQDECKRVYWHDIDHLRVKLKANEDD